MSRSRLRKWAFGTLAVLALLPLIPFTVTAPLGHRLDGSAARANQVLRDRVGGGNGATVVTVDQLTLVTGANIIGYVDMLGPDTIFIKPFADPDSFNSDAGRYSQTVVHEYAHVLQKRLIASTPAWARVSRIAELELALRPYAPPMDPTSTAGVTIIFPGLEGNADCVAARFMSINRSRYVSRSAGCTTVQSAAALSVIAGQWPTKSNVARWTSVIRSERKAASAAVAAAAVDRTRTCVITVRGRAC